VGGSGPAVAVTGAGGPLASGRARPDRRRLRRDWPRSRPSSSPPLLARRGVPDQGHPRAPLEWTCQPRRCASRRVQRQDIGTSPAFWGHRTPVALRLLVRRLVRDALRWPRRVSGDGCRARAQDQRRSFSKSRQVRLSRPSRRKSDGGHYRRSRLTLFTTESGGSLRWSSARRRRAHASRACWRGWLPGALRSVLLVLRGELADAFERERLTAAHVRVTCYSDERLQDSLEVQAGGGSSHRSRLRRAVQRAVAGATRTHRPSTSCALLGTREQRRGRDERVHTFTSQLNVEPRVALGRAVRASADSDGTVLRRSLFRCQSRQATTRRATFPGSSGPASPDTRRCTRRSAPRFAARSPFAPKVPWVGTDSAPRALHRAASACRNHRSPRRGDALAVRYAAPWAGFGTRRVRPMPRPTPPRRPLGRGRVATTPRRTGSAPRVQRSRRTSDRFPPPVRDRTARALGFCGVRGERARERVARRDCGSPGMATPKTANYTTVNY
jgi:hypothetical protein